MKALTLWQPWAWAIVTGRKRVENRPWKPHASVIGEEIAIHAGRVYDKDGERFLRQHGMEPPVEWIRDNHSSIVGVVRVDGFVERGQLHPDPALDDPMFFGRFGWKLSDAVEFEEPYPCSGALSLWRLPFQIDALLAADRRRGSNLSRQAPRAEK